MAASLAAYTTLRESKVKFEGCPRYRQYQAMRASLRQRFEEGAPHAAADGGSGAVMMTPVVTLADRYETPGRLPPQTPATAAAETAAVSATMLMRAAAVVVESQGGRIPKGVAATYIEAFDRATSGTAGSTPLSTAEAVTQGLGGGGSIGGGGPLPRQISTLLVAATGGIPPAAVHDAVKASRASLAAQASPFRTAADSGVGGVLPRSRFPCGSLDPGAYASSSSSSTLSVDELAEERRLFFAGDALRFTTALVPRAGAKRSRAARDAARVREAQPGAAAGIARGRTRGGEGGAAGDTLSESPDTSGRLLFPEAARGDCCSSLASPLSMDEDDAAALGHASAQPPSSDPLFSDLLGLAFCDLGDELSRDLSLDVDSSPALVQLAQAPAELNREAQAAWASAALQQPLPDALQVR